MAVLSSRMQHAPPTPQPSPASGAAVAAMPHGGFPFHTAAAVTQGAAFAALSGASTASATFPVTYPADISMGSFNSSVLCAKRPLEAQEAPQMSPTSVGAGSGTWFADADEDMACQPAPFKRQYR